MIKLTKVHQDNYVLESIESYKILKGMMENFILSTEFKTLDELRYKKFLDDLKELVNDQQFNNIENIDFNSKLNHCSG